MLIEVMRMRIMNNEKKFQDAEKEAGGAEKLIFKFAWPKHLLDKEKFHDHTLTLFIITPLYAFIH